MAKSALSIARLRPPRRRGSRGFTLIELLATVVIIGIVGAIAVPNFLEALTRARQTAAYSSAMQIDAGLNKYMIEYDEPPMWMVPTTLEPLTTEGSLTEDQAQQILRTFENDQFIWYWGFSGWWGWWWGGYHYWLVFRPKGEADPWADCWLMPNGLWRWDQENGWHQVM